MNFLLDIGKRIWYTVNMGITQTILRLRSQWNLPLQEINNGDCGEFSMAVCEKFPQAESVWGDEVCPIFWSRNVILLLNWFTHFAPSHSFIMLDGKFYDCECPQGCNYPDELPVYQRELKVYKQLEKQWAEKKEARTR